MSRSKRRRRKIRLSHFSSEGEAAACVSLNTSLQKYNKKNPKNHIHLHRGVSSELSNIKIVKDLQYQKIIKAEGGVSFKHPKIEIFVLTQILNKFARGNLT